MNYGVFSRREPRRALGEVLLALFFGVIIFAILVLVTGGFLINLIPAAGAMALFALFHYLFWGQVAEAEMAQERRKEESRARFQAEHERPSDEFNLVLNERQRIELMDVLEKSLTEPPQGNERRAQQKETIREVLDRLRGFGA
jgi:hypothetical protein